MISRRLVEPRAIARIVLSAAFVSACNAASGQTVLFPEVFKLTASDAFTQDVGGRSVAISGDTVVMGAPGHRPDFVTDSGAAYLFSASTGNELIKLLPDPITDDSVFGIASAIDGSTVVIGDNNFGRINGQVSTTIGAAFVYPTSGGLPSATLQPAGLGADFFGGAVALDGNIAVFGSPLDDNANGTDAGSAVIFDLSTNTEVRTLLPSPFAGRNFGRSVAIEGNLVAVGASRAIVDGIETGAAYLFDATTGAQIAEFVPSDPDDEKIFGQSVAISEVTGRYVAVGAFFDDDLGENAGAVYVFDRFTGNEIKITATDGAAGDRFGDSIAFSGELLYIGAPIADGFTPDTGAVYVFEPRTNLQFAKFAASDGGGLLGISVDVDGDVLVAGAPATSPGGAAYVFSAAGLGPCNIADYSLPFGVLDVLDTDTFIALFAMSDPAADLVPPFGVVDVDDVNAFLGAFLAGCP